MCAEFPTRFTCLFRGPMWSGVPKEQQKDPLTVSSVLITQLWQAATINAPPPLPQIKYLVGYKLPVPFVSVIYMN